MLNISVPHCELNTHLWVWSVLCVKSRLQGYNISTAEAPSQRRITRLFFFPFADTHIYIHTYIYIDLLLYFLSVPTRQFVWLCVSCFYITGPNLLSRCFRYKHKTLAEITQTLQFVAAQSRRQRKLLIVVSSFEVLRQDWGDGFLYYLVYVVCVCVCVCVCVEGQTGDVIYVSFLILKQRLFSVVWSRRMNRLNYSSDTS